MTTPIRRAMVDVASRWSYHEQTDRDGMMEFFETNRSQVCFLTMDESNAALAWQPSTSASETLVADLDLDTISNRSELMRWFQRAFDFPGYFGSNWDAFIDCLSDLQWLIPSKLVLRIQHYATYAQKEPEQAELLLQCLHAVVDRWNARSMDTKILQVAILAS